MGTGTLFFRRRIPILSLPGLRRQCYSVPPSRQSPDKAGSNSGRLSRTRCRSGRPSLSGNGKCVTHHDKKYMICEPRTSEPYRGNKYPVWKKQGNYSATSSLSTSSSGKYCQICRPQRTYPPSTTEYPSDLTSTTPPSSIGQSATRIHLFISGS